MSDSAVPANGRPVESFGVAEVEEVQSSISDVRVALLGDRVRAHVAFSLYGKAMSFQLEGRVRAENGYLRLEPTAGKVGVLPLPAATLGQAVNQVFDAPKNREKFRLPEAIEDISVVDSRLRVRLRKTR